MLTTGQKIALDHMLAGHNVFLTGKAGTGKSFVLQVFLSKTNKQVMVCAPTGIAAINVGGATLHRTFGIPAEPIGPATVPRHRGPICKADIIVIDEISMCRFDVFEFVTKSIRAAEADGSKKQLIVIGDFFQLSPVLKDEDRRVLQRLWAGHTIRDGFAFLAPSWNDFCFVPIELTEVVRQTDNTFVEHLNRVRTGDVKALEWINQHAQSCEEEGIHLCPTNSLAQQINQREIIKLSNRSHTYRADVSGEVSASDRPADDTLLIKEGMRVMSLVNDTENSYQNGSLGTVLTVSSDSVRVQFDNGHEATIGKYVWNTYAYSVVDDILVKDVIGTYKQLPLKAAYAITIHKSQGQTYDSVNLHPACFAAGQLYVALSRARSIEHLHVCDKIQSKYLKVSEDVVSFYAKLDFVTQSSSLQKQRGGKRNGAGRRRKYGDEETITMRVPKSAVPYIQAYLISQQWT